MNDIKRGFRSRLLAKKYNVSEYFIFNLLEEFKNSENFAKKFKFLN